MKRRLKGRADDCLDPLIGRRLRVAREAAGMTQEALGDVLGITFQQVQKYEKGQNRISTTRLLHCALALDVDPADLMRDAWAALGNKKQAKVNHADRSAEAHEARLVKLGRVLDAIDDKVLREHLIAVARRHAALMGKAKD